MRTVSIRKARADLPRLIARAIDGEPFIITKAGKPLVKVARLDTPAGNNVRRLGFMMGEIAVPDDFDQMGADEIERLFGV
ncbi:MAG: type II toxin-antitoxin system prevent-host-death family antitoxin [Caulobacterales bacterium]|nr:type II toxin-antitoxin system prevent-host-death family antitoxin [Caulobacterales bacterium]